MKMTTKLRLMVAAMALTGSMAMAAVNTDAMIADLQTQGYTWIEVKRGPTQIKIEAIKGTEKVETVIDIATGEVLKRETGVATEQDQGRTGVEIHDRTKDFVGTGASDEDNSSGSGDESSNDDGDNHDGSAIDDGDNHDDSASDDGNNHDDSASDDGDNHEDSASDGGNDDSHDAGDNGSDDHEGGSDNN